MDYAQVRELIRVRHELRRLTAEGKRDEARVMLARLRALVEHDPDEKAEAGAELLRWEARLAV